MTMFDLMGIEGELRRWYGSLMFANEGDEHVRLRRLVNRAFTPRSTERLRADTAASVDVLLDELASKGEGDLVTTFDRLAIRVMCRLLGVPEEDVSIFAGWADVLSPVFTFMEPSQIAEAESALGELLDYVANLVRRRQTDPSEDLITSLLHEEEAGDRLSRDEVITMVSNLLVAGHDTTTSQIGCSLAAIAGSPPCRRAPSPGRGERGLGSVRNHALRTQHQRYPAHRHSGSGGRRYHSRSGSLDPVGGDDRQPRPVGVGRARSLRRHPFRYAVGTEATLVRHRATLLSWHQPGPHGA